MPAETMDACDIPDTGIDKVSFEKAVESFGKQSFWVSFFVRPCCPPPSATQAQMQLDKQRELVRSRADFSSEQKDELLSLIDEGENWYKSTPYWR